MRQRYALFEQLAMQGEARAQHQLGVMHQSGEGALQDDSTAVEWFRKAAEQGHADAQVQLGYMYLYGRGVTEDAGVAAHWYRQAAEQGSAAICLAAAPAAHAADGQTARALSAFFGLDNSLPFGANVLCLGASGEDGMPVVLSHTVDADTLEPEDFRVVTQSGAERTPMCVTLRPANDAGELRTVLLIGEFGDAGDDPPVQVLVVDDLFSDGATGGPVNFRGTQTEVTPLDAGPSLVLAEVVSGDGQSDCPDGTQQVVRVTWAGGVRRPDGDDAGDAERALYRVTVERASGSHDDIAPAALADLGDRDNNHLLCLDTSDPAVSVSFPGGHLVDPNQDLNPDTRVAVDRPAR